MKKMKRTISVVLSSCLLFGATGSIVAAKDGNGVQGHGRVEINLDFKDIKEASWAEAYIKKMKWKKIFAGYEDGTFRPNQSVTQVEAIITAVKLMGLEAEAKAVPADAELLFDDAKLIDNQYSWAKGYIVVALEHGLFDSTDDRIDPAKAASRAWVATLLVKSLGLEAEALTEMTQKPNFKDADAIPAGAVGYVNVALKHNLISGYPDGTFQPNKPVTRAEIATLLDRTSDGQLEQDGAVKVNGTVKAIQFATGDASTVNGQVTIETYGGGTATYGISSGLLVQNGTQFFYAVDLAAGAQVSFTVKDNNVVEASILNVTTPDPLAGILKFTAEFELANDQELEWRYSNRNGLLQAEVEDQTSDLRGDAAVTKMKELLTQLSLLPTMSEQDVLTKVQTVLNVADYQEAQIEVQFANGKTLKVEREKDQQDSDQTTLAIQNFELKADLPGKDSLSMKYAVKDGKKEAEFRKSYKKSQVKLTGNDAVTYVERILKKANITEQMSDSEIAARVVNTLDIKLPHVKKVEMSIDFATDVQAQTDAQTQTNVQAQQ